MISVVVPFAGACDWRRRALDWVTAKYRALGWEVVVGAGDPDEWRKAGAVADAVARCSGDLLVVADADVWATEIEPAVTAVAAGTPWAVPFMHVHRLDRRATQQIYDGEPFSAQLRRARPPYRGVAGGGIVVLPRDLYDSVPLDRRFVGWGREDESWGRALRAIAGAPLRPHARLWHLWHPPQPGSGRYKNEQSEQLAAQYRSAAKDPLRMRQILEGACRHDPGSTLTTARSASSSAGPQCRNS